MRRVMVLTLGLAILSGMAAAISMTDWMSAQYLRMKTSQPPAPPAIELTTVVVAKEDLAFGVAVSEEKLKEAEWPAANVPQGTFKTIAAFMAESSTRFSLAAIKADEPIINGKVTGPGQRSGLSTILEPGKKAVSIRVNDVVGVGGLVLPGDKVDIFVTNEAKGAKAEDGKEPEPYTDLLLQNVRVLAIDQILDPTHSAPILGRTITVETSLADAQRITLASTIGSLSLILRENGNTNTAESVARLSAADLPGNSGDNSGRSVMIPTNDIAPEPKTVAPVATAERHDTAKISIIRATTPTEYTVLRRDPSE